MFKLHHIYEESYILRTAAGKLNVSYMNLLGTLSIGQSFIILNHYRDADHHYTFVYTGTMDDESHFKCVHSRVKVFTL